MDKYKITMKKIKEICENAEELNHVKSMAELKDFFSLKKSKGLWLKDIMEELQAEDIPREKQDRIDWLMEHVQVVELADSLDSVLDTNKVETKEEIKTEKKKENLVDLNIEELNDFFSNVKEEYIIDMSSKLDVTEAIIYENMSVEYQDNFFVKYVPGYYEQVVALAKAKEQKIVAVGRLIQDGKKYHVIFSNRDIDYSQFGLNQNYRLVLFPQSMAEQFEKGLLSESIGTEYTGWIHTVHCVIKYKQMKESSNTLCIDFGTSNTSAGSYSILNPEENNIELVSFTDVTTPDMREMKIYPTIVYVDSCRDIKKIKYLFGYSAKKKMEEKGYDTDASVYFEIKRWIGTLNEKEELHDEEGNTQLVTRRDIVKAYILHIIELSQQYFKVKFEKLHLSAPVKLKEKFYHEISEMLKEDYKVLPTNVSIDEGIAIIYNSISKLVDKEIITEKEKTSIMIMDCGGGTTDLASCEISSKKLDNTETRLNIVTKFVNGNSNFGGNNITFRILQLLKIKLAFQFAPKLMGEEEFNLKDLIPYEENIILNKVEAYYKEPQSGADAQSEIYRKFDDAYEKAEGVIPTIYEKNPDFQFMGEIKKIKRNYFYLWQLAEKIKIKFYEEDLVRVDFEKRENKILEIDSVENYYLYKNNDGELIKVENFGDQIEITINEIRRVLCGDIYCLLNELLPEKEFNESDYRYYRLAGQSCKITLFMDLLKEFIPGRQLRPDKVFEKKGEISKGSIKLKLDCISGCIAYIRDKECGKIKPDIITDKPKLIYDVFINRVDKEKQILFRGDIDNIEFGTYSKKATKAEILVKNILGQIERKIIVNFESSFIEKELNDIFTVIESKGILSENALKSLKEKIEKVKLEESSDGSKKLIIFAVPSKEGYGMNIYRIGKWLEGDIDKYGLFDVLYENYENESTKSFFNGKR